MTRSKHEDAQRRERLRLFGYYRDKTSGAVYPASEVSNHQQATRTGNIPRRPITLSNLEYHAPEAVTDMIDSIGECYVPKGKHYYSLDVHEGEVIRDPKIILCCPNPQVYVHPRLRRWEGEIGG